MLSKRILLFIPLFSLLVGGLLYCFLPAMLYRPRIDSISPTDYVAPWMRPSTPFNTLEVASDPWNIHDVMAGALQLNMTFRITTRNETRVVPSTIYLGHDLDYLYVGGEFNGIGTNPTNEAIMTYPVFMDLFFDVANDGILTFPAAGSRASSIIYNDTWGTNGWVRDRVWINSIDFYRESWIFSDEYYASSYTSRPWPAYSFGEWTSEYDNLTRTLSVVFSRHLWIPVIADSDKLQIRHGECWVVGFLFEVGFTNWGGRWADYVDGWPQKTYLTSVMIVHGGQNSPLT